MQYKKFSAFVLISSLLTIATVAAFHARAIAAPAGTVVLDADDKYIAPLRDDRKKLEEVKEDLKSEASDPRGHRHKAIDGIDSAIKDISDEIDEYKKDHK